jgi:cell migration-inducing and hyaluronan-binding protein
VLAAIGGGRIDLHGAPIARRWTRLAATAPANGSELLLAQGSLGWQPGQRVLVASTSFNPLQAEVRQVTAVAELDGGATTRLTLDAPLSYAHTAKRKTYPGARRLLPEVLASWQAAGGSLRPTGFSSAGAE